MKQLLLILLLQLVSIASMNPYKDLLFDEKLTILSEYLLNLSIKETLPKKPKKITLKLADTIKQAKYETYYDYIQRLKDMNDNMKKKQKEADRKYKNEIKQYNKQIAKLYKYYTNTQHLEKFLNESTNKAFKILYGKPTIKKPFIKNHKLYSTIISNEIYRYNYKFIHDIRIDIDSKLYKEFISLYRTSLVIVNFNYNWDKKLLTVKDIDIIFQNNIYKAYIIKNNFKYKLDIKLDKKLFEPIKLKE